MNDYDNWQQGLGLSNPCGSTLRRPKVRLLTLFVLRSVCVSKFWCYFTVSNGSAFIGWLTPLLSVGLGWLGAVFGIRRVLFWGAPVLLAGLRPAWPDVA